MMGRFAFDFGLLDRRASRDEHEGKKYSIAAKTSASGSITRRACFSENEKCYSAT